VEKLIGLIKGFVFFLNDEKKDNTDGWSTGCCYLPILKRIAVCSEKSLTLWDFKSKKQNDASMVVKHFCLDFLISRLNAQ
jgi:hypothetical protein